MAKDKEKELKEIYDKVESRNRKIARVPTAHFPPFDTVVPTPTEDGGATINPGDSIDDQMRKVTDFEEEHDPVNHPSHYNQFGIECLDAIEASMTPVEFRGYLKGNCQKYIWRYVYKGKPVEDLKKASFYLNKLIEKVEENGV
jgi:hypothetical protein